MVESMREKEHIWDPKNELYNKKKLVQIVVRRNNCHFTRTVSLNASSHVAVESDEMNGETLAVRSSRRKKRVSPTPPPSRCPSVQLPEYLSKWEQLKYLVSTQMLDCHHNGGCCHRRPNPCPYKAEVLAARLAILEEQLREIDRLEARLKIHFTLLNSIQASAKCEY
ncbi:hypothetical protein E2C01_028531 [Portunus trituberculatus]|uniref:Uncharacterized protein n=1 Tax=Portunus trituberculatus TaxID=210409 RepID=A0A5B7EPC0_PORTR|nr:hypothetical protein [Portunus trituberculatus]